MKHVLQLEELAQMALGIAGLYLLPFEFSWWIWILLFLSPDISFFGYCLGKKAGAVIYNVLHHRGVAIAIAATGFLWNNELLILAGTILFTHSSFDRMLGYGLKYFDSFRHTHLGWMK